MSFINFDTEYTTWEGCLQNGWTNGKKKEIVQLSALKVSENFEVIAQFDRVCKPTVNPILSEYFVNLTGITNECIQKNGVTFSELYADFKTFVNGDICCSHSWGQKFTDKSDGEVMAENLQINNLPQDESFVFCNLAEIFKELYQKHNINVNKQSSGEIVNILKLEDKIAGLNLDVHNALYDVYSLLEGLKFFKTEAVELLKNKMKAL